jgi:hypothetical protein
MMRRKHGSFAPKNVWIVAGGDICITEVGLGDILLDVGVLHEHDLLRIIGTEFAIYLAPESWRVPRQGGTSSDIWLIGLVLTEVLGRAGPSNCDCTFVWQLCAKMLPKHGHYFPQASTTGIFNSLSWVACSTFEACFDALPEKRRTAEAILLTPTASSAKPSPCVSPPPDKGGAEIVTLRDVETVTEHVRDAAGTASSRFARRNTELQCHC